MGSLPLRMRDGPLWRNGNATAGALLTFPVFCAFITSVPHPFHPCPGSEGVGYVWLGEFGLPGRRYCRLDHPETGKRAVQAHAYVQGSPEITRHLVFRDALRGNASLRAGYASVKGKCAALHPGDARGYGDCKADWIQKVEARALAASSASGPTAPHIGPVEESPT